MAEIRVPRTKITYAGVDISADVSQYLLSATYTDKLDSDSAEIQIKFEDSHRLWQGSWFPGSKDKISVDFFYENNETLQCGTFEIDDLAFSSNQQGDTVDVGGQATPLSKNLRETRTVEYEDTTLEKIAQQIADRQGLELFGEIVEVEFERITQNEQTDLMFLSRISSEYGQLVKIENDQLIFYDWAELDAGEAQLVLDREDITSISFRKKLEGIYKEAEITYQKGDAKETIKTVIPADPPNNSEDVLKLNDRIENEKQAELKAREQLRRKNADEYTGTLNIEGSAKLVAGINFQLYGFGNWNGKWQIQSAAHKINKSSGWVTSLQIRRISA